MDRKAGIKIISTRTQKTGLVERKEYCVQYFDLITKEELDGAFLHADDLASTEDGKIAIAAYEERMRIEKEERDLKAAMKREKDTPVLARQAIPVRMLQNQLLQNQLIVQTPKANAPGQQVVYVIQRQQVQRNVPIQPATGMTPPTILVKTEGGLVTRSISPARRQLSPIVPRRNLAPAPPPQPQPHPVVDIKVPLSPPASQVAFIPQEQMSQSIPSVVLQVNQDALEKAKKQKEQTLGSSAALEALLLAADQQLTAVDEPPVSVKTEADVKTDPSLKDSPKKKRGRPKGLTKAKLEERKKEKAAQEAHPPKKVTDAAKKRGRGRPPKKKATAKGKAKGKQVKHVVTIQNSSDSSNTSSDNSSETESSEVDSESSDDAPRSKIKLTGESLDKIVKKVRDPPKSPPMQPAKPLVKSPVKARPAEKIQRRLSVSKGPERIAEKVEDLRWAMKKIKDRQEFTKMFETCGHDKMEPTGYLPGRLMQEVEDAAQNGKVNQLARKLYGMKTFTEDGRAIIADEINGKTGESALCKAASTTVANGGPQIITSLCHIGGADPNQVNKNGNTALHIAAENGIPGNVATLLSYLAPVNVKNHVGETPLYLAVARAAKFEKLCLQNDIVEFQQSEEDAYACVEMLLDAGANICKKTFDFADRYSVADLVYLYSFASGDIYQYVKKTMGKVNLFVHDQQFYGATVVPRDQNIFDIVLPPLENFKPGTFLTLFAVHGKYQGFGSGFKKATGMRICGNPCLVNEVRWHKPKLLGEDGAEEAAHTVPLDGMQSVNIQGPFIPGQPYDKYVDMPDDTHFITFLEYTPYRENRYTLTIVPAHWSDEYIFLRVYPCEIQIADSTFQKGAPDILRCKETAMEKWRKSEEEVAKTRQEWKKLDTKKECPLLQKGIQVKNIHGALSKQY